MTKIIGHNKNARSNSRHFLLLSLWSTCWLNLSKLQNELTTYQYLNWNQYVLYKVQNMKSQKCRECILRTSFHTAILSCPKILIIFSKNWPQTTLIMYALFLAFNSKRELFLFLPPFSTADCCQIIEIRFLIIVY